jgi:RNA polymerase sigma-70 factor (ECF subfamily)
MLNYNILTDDELSFLLKERDHHAFTEIYNRYQHILYIHAIKLVKDPDEAQDILHDLFTALWDKAAELNTSIPLRAYLFKSIKNRVFDLFSRLKVRSGRLLSLQEFMEQGKWVTDEALREKELIDIIEKEVGLLPAKMQTVFKMSRNENLSYREIAEELCISDKTVKKQVSNAIKILRKRISLMMVIMVTFLCFYCS